MESGKRKNGLSWEETAAWGHAALYDSSLVFWPVVSHQSGSDSLPVGACPHGQHAVEIVRGLGSVGLRPFVAGSDHRGLSLNSNSCRSGRALRDDLLALQGGV